MCIDDLDGSNFNEHQLSFSAFLWRYEIKSKNTVLFAIEAAKVGRILLTAKNQTSITCKNLLTKRPRRLKKSETPVCKGVTAYMVLQTTHLAIVNGAFSLRKRPVCACPLPLPFPPCTPLFFPLPLPCLTFPSPYAAVAQAKCHLRLRA